VTAVTVPAANARRADDRTAATWRLVRLVLRRDRIKLPAWLLGLTVFVFYFNSALPIIAPTEADLAAFSQFSAGPVGAVLSGPGYGFDAGLSYEQFFVGTYGLYFLLAAALMNILLVSRHTRVEEQSGRAELVRAGAVGRSAPLTATLIVACAADVLLALLLGGATATFGYAPGGALLFGAGVGAVGLVFAAVTAVTVQITEYSRAASGLAGAVLGVAYLIRAAGDSLTEHGSLLSWFSPLAWSQQTRPFVDGRWWPLLLSLGLAGVTTAGAFALADRRDLGAGLRAARRGPSGAAPWLRSPSTLALRLQRAGLLGWTTALVVLGLTYGALVGPMTDTFAELSGEFAAVIGAEGDVLNGYLSFMAVYDVIIVSAFAILAVHRVRTEETSGRAEPVLATATGRVRWLGTHLLVVCSAAATILVMTGLAFGIGAAASTGDVGQVAELTASHAVRIPEVLVFAAVGVLLYGIAPRALPLVWLVYAYAVVLALFGQLLDLPQWVHDLSPVDHIGRTPLEDAGVVPVVALCGIAALAAAAGLAAFRGRDLTGA
jgi:ABC-2 type transport system permease protein